MSRDTFWADRNERWNALLCSCGHTNADHPTVNNPRDAGHCLLCLCARRETPGLVSTLTSTDQLNAELAGEPIPFKCPRCGGTGRVFGEPAAVSK